MPYELGPFWLVTTSTVLSPAHTGIFPDTVPYNLYTPISLPHTLTSSLPNTQRDSESL